MSESVKGEWQYIGGIPLSIPGLPSSGQVYEVIPPINGHERVVLLEVKGNSFLVGTDRRNQTISAKAITTMSGLYDARTLFGLMGYRASNRFHSALSGQGAQGGEGAQKLRRVQREKGKL